ncbi:MAG: trypsin-like serine peptidase [Nocardioides sp.]
MRPIHRIAGLIGVGTVAIALLGSSLVVSQSAAAVRLAPSGPPPAAPASVSGTSPVTTAATRAGRLKFGADASRQETLRAFWTPRRMAAATPIEDSPAFIESVRQFEARQKTSRARDQRQPANDGPTHRVSGAESQVLDTPAAGTPADAAVDPGASFDTPTAYRAGKVFFNSGGQSFACSGTIVNSEGKNSVWTAGHCVHGGKGGTWHGDWIFVPAYDDDLADPRPYGTWSAAALASRTAWVNDSDFSQDMGVATMNPRSGNRIVDYFGGHGLVTNLGRTVYVDMFGYPGESPFDGGNLYRCHDVTKPEWETFLSWSQTLQIPCDMTRGASGGAWLYQYDGNVGYLNGVNSRLDRIVDPTTWWSPYFDEDAWDLYNYTRYN